MGNRIFIFIFSIFRFKEFSEVSSKKIFFLKIEFTAENYISKLFWWKKKKTIWMPRGQQRSHLRGLWWGTELPSGREHACPCLNPFVSAPKKTHLRNPPSIPSVSAPKKTFCFCPQESKARTRRPASRVFVRVFHRLCCRRNSLKNRFAVGFGEISFYFLVFFLSVFFFWNNSVAKAICSRIRRPFVFLFVFWIGFVLGAISVTKSICSRIWNCCKPWRLHCWWKRCVVAQRLHVQC